MEESAPPVLLAGDIGGTNSRFALFEAPIEHLEDNQNGKIASQTCIFHKNFKNEKFGTFMDVLREFLHETMTHAHLQSVRILVGCLAVAGPVKDDAVTFTNLGWFICGREIELEFGIERVRLINDFAAVGYGLLTLEPNQVEVLQEGINAVNAPIACLGAGTGLGEVFLCHPPDGVGRYEAYPSEGGHKEYPPRNELEAELLRFLQQKFKGRVSVERVVSGKGLRNIYEFLREKYPDRIIKQKDDTIMNAESEAARFISQFKFDYPLCQTAMELMVRAYGAEAGNLALQFMPFGGLYITQGIVLKNLEMFTAKNSSFMQSFRDKGRVSAFTSQIPVKIVLVEDLGMKGARVVGARMLAAATAPVAPSASDTAGAANFVRSHAHSHDDEENLGLLFFVGSLALVYTTAWYLKGRL
eukprot:m.860603 g.860603  ORF g.860603 m.860603 type:complete len:414 (-) comp23529_c0_seq12:3989-5230(-)